MGRCLSLLLSIGTPTARLSRRNCLPAAGTLDEAAGVLIDSEKAEGWKNAGGQIHFPHSDSPALLLKRQMPWRMSAAFEIEIDGFFRSLIRSTLEESCNFTIDAFGINMMKGPLVIESSENSRVRSQY
jgi:hypothetical protein